MKVAEKIAIENQRTNEQLYVAHLYCEGSLWCAYDYSAFLISEYARIHGNKLKIIHKKENDLYECLSVGFPMRNIEKYLPGVQVLSTDNQGSFDFRIFHPDIHTIEDAHVKVNAIKQLMSLKINQEKGTYIQLPNVVYKTNGKPNSKLGILTEIELYDLNGKTREDLYNFLTYIKKEIIGFVN